MPKIEVDEESFYRAIGRRIPEEELGQLLTIAKAELDGREGSILKIELNDTNRPDLWSTAGLARQLRVYLTGTIPRYDFLSTPAKALPYGERVIEVDSGLEHIRPYVAAFAVSGKGLADSELKDIIQTQEKLCWNYGRKRQSIAMGVYRHDRMKYPVRYLAADPRTTRFTPLGFERELSLAEILEEHPKGKEFGSIVAPFPRFPYLTDSTGETLSFPPVINSANLGAVQVGDSELFIELTGTDLDSLLTAASIVACDLRDAVFEILPVKTRYPYDTKLGREIVCPFYFQEPLSVDVEYASRLLGDRIEPEAAAASVRRMGCPATVSGGRITVTVPEYRNDYLHPVDIVEDIMMGRGLDTFTPLEPSDFTVGRLSEIESFARRAKDIMIGLGYQEMLFNYLGSRKDYIDRMCVDGSEMVQIANPMSENYEYVRSSVLPALLGAESVSANAAYPHAVFEVGKVAFLDSQDATGTVTRDYLGFLYSDRNADFNLVRSQIAAVLFYLSAEHRLEELEDPRFIPGRSARIIVGGAAAGIVGEIHPQVLENWGIQMPCSACEIDVGAVLAAARER